MAATSKNAPAVPAIVAICTVPSVPSKLPVPPMMVAGYGGGNVGVVRTRS